MEYIYKYKRPGVQSYTLTPPFKLIIIMPKENKNQMNTKVSDDDQWPQTQNCINNSVCFTLTVMYLHVKYITVIFNRIQAMKSIK